MTTNAHKPPFSEWVIDSPTLDSLHKGRWWLLLGDLLNPPVWEIGTYWPEHYPRGPVFDSDTATPSTVHLTMAGGLLIGQRGFTGIRRNFLAVVSAAPAMSPPDELEDHRRRLYLDAIERLTSRTNK